MGLLSRWIGIATMATAATFSAAPAVRAADMPMAPPLEPAVNDTPVLFGSGWYLRGDLSISKQQPIAVGAITLPRYQSFPNSWAIGIGGGYKFNEWFRTDITLDWRRTRVYSGNTAARPCITGWVSNGTVPPTESAQYDTCSDWVDARLREMHLLFNVYADLGTWWGVTPYIGVGAGFNQITQQVARSWAMSNGVPYQITVPDAISPSQWYYNWNVTQRAQNYQFAWAAMAGFSYAFSQNAAVDVGYRYLNLGQVYSISNLGGVVTTKSNTIQEVRIGVRYTPDF